MWYILCTVLEMISFSGKTYFHAVVFHFQECYIFCCGEIIKPSLVAAVPEKLELNYRKHIINEQWRSTSQIMATDLFWVIEIRILIYFLPAFYLECLIRYKLAYQFQAYNSDRWEKYFSHLWYCPYLHRDLNHISIDLSQFSQTRINHETRQKCKKKKWAKASSPSSTRSPPTAGRATRPCERGSARQRRARAAESACKTRYSRGRAFKLWGRGSVRRWCRRGSSAVTPEFFPSRSSWRCLYIPIYVHAVTSARVQEFFRPSWRIERGWCARGQSRVFACGGVDFELSFVWWVLLGNGALWLIRNSAIAIVM